MIFEPNLDPIETLTKSVRTLGKENRELRQMLQSMRMEFYDLRRAVLPSPLKQDTFALFRIIGNDLPPRHQSGQTLANIRFILDHEPQRPGVIRQWVLNRIIDQKTEDSLIRMLSDAGETFHRIAFDIEAYARLSWNTTPLKHEATPLYDPKFVDAKMTSVKSIQNRDLLLDSAYHDKILYVANNNGARNTCLELGRDLAGWIMPWDGNCFLTDRSWELIRQATQGPTVYPYVIVPMARITDNQVIFDPSWQPDAQEEPQIIFRTEAREVFDPSQRYGRRPKVELLRRLRVPGLWDKWPMAAWEPEIRASSDAGLFTEAGYVVRLASGADQLEAAGAATQRGIARSSGIRGLINRIDEVLIRQNLAKAPTRLLHWPTLLRQQQRHAEGAADLVALIGEELLPSARRALTRGPYSVLDKRDCAPSGDKRDYWHPAPYHWPDEESPTGLPFKKRDGMRVPGTRFGDPEAVNYDRTSLQAVFDDTLTLALAAFFSGETVFADHAVRLLRCWFVDEDTRMNPNMAYAQMITGVAVSRGRGIIEAKDLHYFLDAVGLLDHMGWIPVEVMAVFRFWLSSYQKWLLSSPQGISEKAMENNHGTAYDLQVAAIAAFLGQAGQVQESSLLSSQRLYHHFSADGGQPHEVSRSTSQHYCHFNLQLWVALADLYQSCGIDLWQFEAAPGRSLPSALRHLAGQMAQETWPGEQIDAFDADRTTVLLAGRLDWAPQEERLATCPNTLDPYSAVRPWWRLGNPALPV